VTCSGGESIEEYIGLVLKSHDIILTSYAWEANPEFVPFLLRLARRRIDLSLDATPRFQHFNRMASSVKHAKTLQARMLGATTLTELVQLHSELGKTMPDLLRNVCMLAERGGSFDIVVTRSSLIAWYFVAWRAIAEAWSLIHSSTSRIPARHSVTRLAGRTWGQQLKRINAAVSLVARSAFGFDPLVMLSPPRLRQHIQRWQRHTQRWRVVPQRGTLTHRNSTLASGVRQDMQRLGLILTLAFNEDDGLWTPRRPDAGSGLPPEQVIDVIKLLRMSTGDNHGDVIEHWWSKAAHIIRKMKLPCVLRVHYFDQSKPKQPGVFSTILDRMFPCCAKPAFSASPDESPRDIMNFLRFTMEIGAGDAVRVTMETEDGGDDAANDCGNSIIPDDDVGEAESVLREQTRQPSSCSFEGMTPEMVALQDGFGSVNCVCFSQETNVARENGGPLHYATCGAAGMVVRSYASGELVEPTTFGPVKAPSSGASGVAIVSVAFIRQVPPRLLAVTTAGDVLEFGAGAPKKRAEFDNMHAACLAVSTSGLVAVGGTARSAGTGGSGVVGLWRGDADGVFKNVMELDASHEVTSHHASTNVTKATDPVVALSFSADGLQLVAATYKGDGLVMVWNVQRSQRLWELGVPRKVHSVALAPDHRHVAVGCDTALLRITSKANGRVTSKPLVDGVSVLAVAYSPDGTKLAYSAVESSGSSASVKVIVSRSDGAEFESVLASHDGGQPVNSLQFSPDSSRLLGGGAQGDVFMWFKHQVVCPTCNECCPIPASTDAASAQCGEGHPLYFADWTTFGPAPGDEHGAEETKGSPPSSGGDSGDGSGEPAPATAQSSPALVRDVRGDGDDGEAKASIGDANDAGVDAHAGDPITLPGSVPTVNINRT